MRTNSRLRPGSVELATVGGGVGAVGVELPGEGALALGDFLGQVALVEAEPVAVAQHLVVGVDSGDRVLEIHDRGDGRLQDDVLDPGGVRGTDRRFRVDQDLDVQAVVDQQDGCGVVGASRVAGELLGCREPGEQVVAECDQHLAVLDLEAEGVGVGPTGQRDGLVEEPAGIGNDLVAAHLVVAGGFLGAIGFSDDVGAVQRVVKRTPAGVGGVQREPCVEHRHHQLRARGRGDLVVDAGRGDGEVVRFGQQVADFGEELSVGLRVDRLDDVLAVPSVDPGLQFVAACQQVLVLRCQIGDDFVHARPEAVGIDIGTRQGLIVDEVVQHLGHAQVANRHAIGHVSSLERSIQRTRG